MDLFPHQQEELELFGRHQARALLWEPRVGKTRAVIAQMSDYYAGVAQLTERMVVNGAGVGSLEANFRGLVICPKNVAPVWISEFDEAWPSMRLVDLSSGALTKRRAAILGLGRTPSTIIVNDEVLYELIRELRSWGPTWVVADESHRFKSAGARRSKALHMLAAAPMRRILTGTPDPQSYVDFYSQYKFLVPGLLSETKAQFEERYVIRHPMFKSQVIKYRQLSELQAKIFSVATRLRRADCRGVPSVQEVIRKVPLPPRARSLYDDIVSKLVTQTPAGTTIDARHTLVRLLRTAQLTAGFLPNAGAPNGEEDVTDVTWHHEAKLQAVVGELGEILAAGKKAVVFFRFRPEGRQLTSAIQRAFSDDVAVCIDGLTPPEDRQLVIEPKRGSFHKPDSPVRVLVMQEKIGSLGIDLSPADYCLFSTMSFDYATHTQARDRIWKPEGKLCYIYFVAPKTIDEYILKALRRKKSASTMMLDSKAFARAAQGED